MSIPLITTVVALSMIPGLSALPQIQPQTAPKLPRGALIEPAPAPLMLFSLGQGPAVSIPGVAGDLLLDTSSLLIQPEFPGFPHQLDALLLGLPRSSFAYQLLERQPNRRLPELSSVLPVSRAAFAQVDTESTCRHRAQELLDSVRGSDMAPGWDRASIDPAAVPFLRPDVQGVAYYEFSVQPAGFIIVSTGEHDAPVAHWNFAGRSIGATLREQASSIGETVSGFYKLDTLCYVGEDAGGQKVANVGQLPSRIVPDATTKGGYRLAPWATWQDLKTNFAPSYRAMTENLRASVSATWARERAKANSVNGTWSSWKYYWAGSSTDQRFYDQWQMTGCLSGCGATAWAMLFGWADYRAHQGDPAWSGRTDIYRTGGSRTGSADEVAPRYNDYGVRTMIREIRGQVGTFCMTNSGATAPWDMPRAVNYLIGRTAARCSATYNSVGYHDGALTNRAITMILVYKTPAVIGTGWLSHYPLAYGYAYRYMDDIFGRHYDRWFYVNQGWGGSGNGWVGSGTWFCGELHR